MVGGFTFVSYLETMNISNCRRIDDAGVVVEQNPNGATVQRWLTRIYCRYSYLRRKKEMKAVASAELFV
jgi:hypothetical protein